MYPVLVTVSPRSAEGTRDTTAPTTCVRRPLTTFSSHYGHSRFLCQI